MNECEFSADRVYRYSLVHSWGQGPRVAWIGLNPSTADEQKLDPTLKKVRRFSEDWSFGSFVMLNLFAFRATLPRDMKAATDPVGDENEIVLLSHALRANTVICAWGKDGSFRSQDSLVKLLLRERGISLKCLRQNKDGSPMHPLYIPYSESLKPYA